MSKCSAVIALAGSMAVGSLLSAGCFSTMSYQTADTVPKGGVEFAMGWSVIKWDRISVTDDSGHKESVNIDDLGTIPNLPEYLMRFGLGDNLDIGFRLFLLGIHLDTKVRLVNTDVFSLALNPGISYSRPFIAFGEYAAELPVLVTFKLGEHFQIYAGIKGRVSGWQLEMFDLGEEDGHDSSFHTVGVGGHLGLSFGGRRWYIRPEVGYVKYLAGFEERCRGSVDLEWFTFGIGAGFRIGIDDERQDDKLERLEKRIEELEREKAEGSPSDVDGVRRRAEESVGDLEREEGGR